MEYKEALEYLKIMRKFFTNDDDEGKVLKQAYDVAIKACKKQIQKKPDYEADGYDSNGELIYDTWICPNCEKRYEVDYDSYDCCPKCGQAIDWNEVVEE